MIGINPAGMEVIEWADRMTPIIINEGASGDIGRLDDESNWQEWARGVILSNTNWQSTAPNPYQFTDWRLWAERFLQIMVT
jgi:hypothetical protein